MSETDDPTFPYDIEEVMKETVKQTLIQIGLDISDPIEVQKDFAHLRMWRESSEAVKRKGMMTVIGVLIAGLLGLIWSAFRSSIH